jgi:hypothetical protein
MDEYGRHFRHLYGWVLMQWTLRSVTVILTEDKDGRLFVLDNLFFFFFFFYLL